MKTIFIGFLSAYLGGYLLAIIFFADFVNIALVYPFYLIHYLIAFVAFFLLNFYRPKSTLLKLSEFFPILLILFFWICGWLYDFLVNNILLEYRDIYRVFYGLIPFLITSLVFYCRNLIKSKDI
jgi:hypothetical protein